MKIKTRGQLVDFIRKQLTDLDFDVTTSAQFLADIERELTTNHQWFESLPALEAALLKEVEIDGVPDLVIKAAALDLKSNVIRRCASTYKEMFGSWLLEATTSGIQISCFSLVYRYIYDRPHDGWVEAELSDA